jgi:hypothetical protein
MLTDGEARALGERWIAAGGGWRRGMWARPTDPSKPPNDRGGWLVSDVRADGVPLFDFDWYGDMREPLPADAWPDPRDPATRGAMLEVVRERWGIPGLSVRLWPSPSWTVWEDGPHADRPLCHEVPGAAHLGPLPIKGPTEAEAFVAALEAAPR